MPAGPPCAPLLLVEDPRGRHRARHPTRCGARWLKDVVRVSQVPSSTSIDSPLQVPESSSPLCSLPSSADLDPAKSCRYSVANSGGGVRGKMVAPQSVVVASTASRCYGQEGDIIRFVILHSIALACLIGLLASFVVRSPTFTRLFFQQLSTIEHTILTTHGRPSHRINGRCCAFRRPE